MSGESGIQVEKSTSVWRKDIKVNPKSLFMSLGKAAINGAFLKWDELAKSGVEVLDALGLEKEPGEIAGLLIVRSLMQAMQDLLRENRELVQQPDNLQGLYQQLNSSLASGELVINQEFFLRPQQLPIVQTAKTGFLQWLEEFVEKPVEAQKISDRLPTYFIFALNDQWVKHSQDYLVLKEVLDTPFTQATKREQGWLRYRAWLQKRVEEPMFLEAFSLKQVYVPLRAYYEREVKCPPEQRLEGGIVESNDKERVVVNLNKELETWLREAKSDDAIRLISGGPGSGKSSFGKIFAAQLAEKGEIPVLFIPLHLFKLSDDLVRAIGEFVQVEGFLPHNPLDRSDGESRLLIIFDGLDELSMQGKIAAEAAREFIEEVRLKVNQFNQHHTRLQVLISGREVVVQANRSKFRQPQQLLYLLPYFVIEAEREDFVDEQKLLEQDQRQLWWQSYGKAKGKNYTGLPPELDRDNLLEITTQPLLNYLVALSIERDKLQFSEDTNLNQIYEDLLEAVYERGYENNRYHRVTEGIQKDDFTDILEEIALACWHGDGRTTTVGEIEKHCDNSGLRGILDRFQESFNEDSKASVTRLLTAFYFRESGGVRASEKTFEFTHKSFGEYLTAKRIVLGVKLIYEDLEERQKNRRKGCDESEALVTWANLCGASAMDEYLFRFIRDEISVQNPSDVGKWQKTLCSLIEFMLNHGMPMECLTDIPNFHEKMRQARNAEEALLAVLNACARVTKEVSEIKWPSPDAFGAWISRLQGQRIGGENVLVLDCLSFLDLQGCILQIRDFFRANLERANLERANLKGVNLYKAILEEAILEEAILERANLKGVNLEGAYLEWAILYKANLEGANLKGAILYKADLEGANLEGVILEGANLKGVILEGAKLQWANLEGADLEGAKLQWANLEGANLEGAKLQWVILEGANLKGVILEGADLEGAKLQWANLEGAKFQWANLEGANLEGANLKGTILEGKDSEPD
ncbi:MAG: pentapeptide repeat-containing protein [Symploca sp. SIO1B1]|nr:pentapeptide repeat-containing protein [Symploca sp. SIO1B1]